MVTATELPACRSASVDPSAEATRFPPPWRLVGAVTSRSVLQSSRVSLQPLSSTFMYRECALEGCARAPSGAEAGVEPAQPLRSTRPTSEVIRVFGLIVPVTPLR